MHSFIHAQALSVNLRKQTLDGASRNISRLNSAIDRAKVCLMLTDTQHSIHDPTLSHLQILRLHSSC